MIPNRPHGDKLINRVLEGKAREEWLQRAAQLPKVRLNARQLSDVEMIAVGAFSPLEGLWESGIKRAFCAKSGWRTEWCGQFR